MAGAGYKLFNTGDVLTAAQVNTYLQEQAVMRFANAAARTTALSGVLAEGMVSYLMDTDAVEVYTGAAWVSIGSSGDITAVTTAANSGLTGGATSGDVALRINTTAKGSLIAGTGASTLGELTVGANNTVLTADSSTATGLKWATPSSGLTYITGTNFSAVSSVALPTSTFTSTYRFYKVIFTVNSAVTTGAMTLRARSAGSDLTASNYNQASVGLDRGASTSNLGQNNQSSLDIGTIDGTYFNYSLVLDVIEPQISQEFHSLHGHLMFWNGTTYIGRAFNGAYVSAASSFDSLSFIKAAGSMTGNYRVYGYQNS